MPPLFEEWSMTKEGTWGKVENRVEKSRKIDHFDLSTDQRCGTKIHKKTLPRGEIVYDSSTRDGSKSVFGEHKP
jgi:hypothetical protein